MKLSNDEEYRAAITNMSRGRYAAAQRLLRNCLKRTDEDVEIAFFHRMIAKCFAEQQMLEDARNAFSFASDVDPSPFSLVKEAEFLATHLRDRDASLTTFLAAIKKGHSYSEGPFSPVKFERQTRELMRQLDIGDELSGGNDMEETK